MNLGHSEDSISDLLGALDRGDIIINKEYQRGLVWPDSARSYLIDTIIEGYPFPKIFLYLTRSSSTNRQVKEVVDGQQRLTTIKDFYNGKFALNSASKNYHGLKFTDLSEEAQHAFEGYQVESSIIRSADRTELLEMFRRINAYTATLNSAEKRHAKYQGPFKWFIVDMADEYAPVLSELRVFTMKLLTRMADAEFLADMIVTLKFGVSEKKASTIEKIYKLFEDEFPHSDEYERVISDFFSFLTKDLSPLHGSFLMKSYVVNSLFAAFVHCKYGLPFADELTETQPDARFTPNLDIVIPLLETLADAHENKDEDGIYKEYVKSCLSSTTKSNPRKVRFKILVNALKNGSYAP